MGDASFAKAALNIWCSKKKLKIDYDIETIDPTNFVCKANISTINYTCSDSGPNKKIASNNCALKFMNYLVDNGYISESELSLPCFEQLSIKDKLFSNPSRNSPSISSNNSQKDYWNPPESNLNTTKNFQNERYMPLARNYPPRQEFHSNSNRYSYPKPYPPDQYQSNFRTNFNRGNVPYGPQSNYLSENDRYRSQHNNYFLDSPVSRFNAPPPSFFHDAPPPRRNASKPYFGNNHFYKNNDSMMSDSWRNKNEPPQYEKPIINDSKRCVDNTANKNNSQGVNNYWGIIDSKMDTISISQDTKKRKSDIPPKPLENVGNFTFENAKQLLNIFFQTHRIKTDYVYSSYGPQHKKVFFAILKFNAGKYNQEYYFKQSGNSKQDASRSCALMAMQQLHKDGLVNQYDSDAPSKRQLMKSTMIYDVKVNSKLKESMQHTYNYIQLCNQFKNTNLPTNQQSNLPNSDSIYWIGPMEDFNPWTNSNLAGSIYEGKSKNEIDSLLQTEFTSMVKTPKFQKILTSRMNLPIWGYKDELILMIQNNPVIIIKGSTGCGKTTQVPQFILDSYIKNGNGSNCNIIVTQPRRISAISIAERICFERIDQMKELESSVGYSVRFDHIYPRAYGSILFCTTGHLLRRILGGLKGISHLVIDEVHERDINTDLLLKIVRDLINMNLDIRIIIMSATLGVSHFQQYFNDCVTVEINNRVFPVTRYYLEDCIELLKWKPNKLTYLDDDVEVDPTDDALMEFDFKKSYSESTVEVMRSLKEGVICFELILALLDYINTIYVTGSVLIFMPGWNSIFSLLNVLSKHPKFGNSNKFLLLPLHSQLSHKENNRIFQYSAQRKIILSTNIAETSITIDDVVFVIDTCLIKRKIYSPHNNVTSYIIDWVSKSNIQQREGRAGRVRSGYNFVLCSKKRYEMMEQFKKPEILVTSLVETSLLIKYLGFGSVSDFLQQTLDPPSNFAIEEAMKLLQDINAFDHDNELTPLGKILAKMPIDPKIGKMILQSILLEVASPIITIAAASSDNFEMLDHTDLNLYLKTLNTLDENRFSDHLILFKIFSMCSTSRQVEKTYTCINLNAVSVIENVRRQLIEILKKCNFNENLFRTKTFYTQTEFDIISGLLVTAFYPNICIHKESRKILTNEERIGLVHKTSIIYSYIMENKITKCTNLKSPLFVYSEKTSNNKLISSKQMSMVTFLHLLLLGVRKFEFPAVTDVNLNTIILDSWIEIKVDPEVFDFVLQIKTEFESLLSRVCEYSSQLDTPTQLDTSVLNTVKDICQFDNCSVGVTVRQNLNP